MIPLNNLSSRTKYEKNDFLNLTSPLSQIKNIIKVGISYSAMISLIGYRWTDDPPEARTHGSTGGTGPTGISTLYSV